MRGEEGTGEGRNDAGEGRVGEGSIYMTGEGEGGRCDMGTVGEGSLRREVAEEGGVRGERRRGGRGLLLRRGRGRGGGLGGTGGRREGMRGRLDGEGM